MKAKSVMFLIVALAASIGSFAQTMTAYEYWFDMDYANRTNVSISGGTTVNINASINTGTLSQGNHIFWFHTQSSDGRWSVPVSSPFVKGNNEIVGVEYWYDNDYSTKEYMSLTPSQGEAYSLGLPVSGIAIGNHQISISFVDNEQIRSVPISTSFYYDGTVLGISELKKLDGLQLFPNPANEEIQLSGITDYTHLVIYDIQGKVVLNKSISSNTEKVAIENLSPGLYTILLLSETQNTSLSFIKN